MFRRALILAAIALSAFAWTDRDDAWVAGRKNYWAFQRPVREAAPALKDPWIRTPIDAFLLSAMKAKGLAPSAPLDRERLFRRLSLDLTGLNPTPGELDLFLADKSANAYEKAVDRLLASPHYGERWALRWLDVVRYADTNGYELDLERPQAWRYRDYVIRSFQNDKPYDRFIKEQIAGDELYPGNNEALIATGFHRAGPIHLVGGNQDVEANRQEVLVEMTAGVSAAFMGLTVGCARCHNHKFDPILQADYYRLQAVMAATDYKDIEIASAAETATYEVAKKQYEAKLEPIKKAIAAIEKPYREKLSVEKKAKLEPALLKALEIPKAKRTKEEQELAKNAESQISPSWDEVVATLPPTEKETRAGLRRQLHQIEWSNPEPPASAYAVVNMEKAPSSFILKVGDTNHKMGEVQPGFLTVLGGVQAPTSPQGRRAALANWLASPEHPLTARVMVNRIWQFRMGTGLVATPNDFGVLGARPSNQKLLDWLATEFMAKNWSVKAIDRMLVLSSAYRQSVVSDPAKTKLDPDNKYYSRMNRRRLEGELIRDNILEAAGSLNTRIGGKPVKTPIEPEIYDLIFTEGEPDNLWPVSSDPKVYNRRSLYLLNKRTVRLPILANFDQPDEMSSCAARSTSTHALQALTLMNSSFMEVQSHVFAARLERECGADTDCRLRRAYKLTLARIPKPSETAMAKQFLAKGGELKDFCLALLNRNEFVYIP
jgi:hypothetical protein